MSLDGEKLTRIDSWKSRSWKTAVSPGEHRVLLLILQRHPGVLHDAVHYFEPGRAVVFQVRGPYRPFVFGRKRQAGYRVLDRPPRRTWFAPRW